MEKKKIIIFLAIVLVVSLCILGLLFLKKYGTKEGAVGNDQFGMKEIEEVIPPEQKDNVIISEQLGYKFTIPEGYELTEIGTADTWNGQDTYLEFSVMNVEKQHILSVLIIPMDGDSFRDTGSEFDREKILEGTFEQIFGDFKKQSIVYKDYCGLPCAFYDDEISKTKSDGTNWHMGEYVYAAPYVEVDFMVVRPEEDAEEMNMLFDCFEILE